MGDPKFAVTPGYAPESYRPSSTSPAAGSASDVGVSNDFFARPRGPSFDIGSIQFATSSATSIPQATTTSVPPTIAFTRTLSPATSQATVTSMPPTSQITTTSLPASPAPTIAVTATPTSLPATATSTSTPVSSFPTATLQPTQQPSQSTEGTTYDNKNSAFVYSNGWIEEVSTSAMGGSYARTATNGSSVTFQFTGQSFSLIYKGGPSYRKMNVYLDNVLVGTIDEWHDVSTYKARWDYPGQFALGQHTLKLVFLTTSSSTNGSVDAVIVR